jgi:TnpA family transposase
LPDGDPDGDKDRDASGAAPPQIVDREQTIMTDTGAYTDVVFGLFWLLGFRFSSRIADIGGAMYWRTDPFADYGALTAWHAIKSSQI